MDCEQYLLPDNKKFCLVTRAVYFLIQKVEGGVRVVELEKDEIVQERMIPELTPEKDIPLRELAVGEAVFTDVAQCFYFVLKAIKDPHEFLARVFGYGLRPPEGAGMQIAVAFYGMGKAITEAVDMTESSTPGRVLVGGGHA